MLKNKYEKLYFKFKNQILAINLEIESNKK